MIQSTENTNKWDGDFANMVNQQHMERVWTVMLPIAKKYIENYLYDIVNVAGITLSQNAIKLHVRKLIMNNDNLHDKYVDIFSLSNFEDAYLNDPDTFKSVILSKETPIIYKTLFSKAKALNEWKAKFYHAKPENLCRTFYNIMSFAVDYDADMSEYELSLIHNIEDCYLDEMEYQGNGEENESCYLQGVVGYGIVANILCHMYPRTFAGNYKFGIYALHFMSATQSGMEGIDMPSGSSEFLMVKDMMHSRTGIIETEHNYYFPYYVYYVYTLRVFELLQSKIKSMFDYDFPVDYRFLLTNDFYNYVAAENRSAIQTMNGNDDIWKFGYTW